MKQGNKTKAEPLTASGQDPLPSFQSGLLKFSDSLIVSTSATSDQISIWEPHTLAPLETFKSDKFFAAPNTLSADRDGHITATHLQKTTLAAWRWDQTREPIIRSPLKDEVTAMRVVGAIG